jgi:hypothetical protein
MWRDLTSRYRFGRICNLSRQILNRSDTPDQKLPLRFKIKTEPWISDPTVREKREKGPHRRLWFRRARGQGSNAGDILELLRDAEDMDVVRGGLASSTAWSAHPFASR